MRAEGEQGMKSLCMNQPGEGEPRVRGENFERENTGNDSASSVTKKGKQMMPNNAQGPLMIPAKYGDDARPTISETFEMSLPCRW